MSKSIATSSTEQLAREAAKLSFGDLPPAAVLVAKQCLLDSLGVGLAGSDSDPARLVAAVALEEAGDGPCTILGRSAGTGASGAALANGTAIHALDYDDMSAPLCGHPSAPIVPVLLALGEQLGASGSAVLGAFVAGYEAESRLGASVDPGHYRRGFHATATVGTIGAAVAGAQLLGLDAEHMEVAIGIAATQAAGLKSMFGTMCKPLHAGRAAASGILAARLARDGFTSAKDALACEQGFATTLGDGFAREELESPFGRSPWYLLGNLFKFHAACYFTHGVIETMLELRRRGLDATSIDHLELVVPRQHLAVCNIEAPTTGLEGKFSLRFAAAVTLAWGAADETCFTDDAVREPSLIELQRRVTVRADDALRTYDTVVLATTRAGEQRVEHDSARRAWVADPAEQGVALLEKFHSLVEPKLGGERATELASLVLDLEHLEDLRTLRPLLVPSGNAA